MAALPVISGRDAVKVFEKLGFIFHRQKGSHIILSHPNGRHLSVPIIESSIEVRSAP
jgi:predicted RNA binding protein YcfA (HicA-like mRNA interferase family)